MKKAASLLIGFLAAVSNANVAVGSEVQIKVSGQPLALYTHAKDACEDWDVPDTPARAYRDEHNRIHVFATHFHNRQLVGDSFLSLKHACQVVFEGQESKDPQLFSDRSWVAGTYTLDGKTVYGLVHNEYQANRWPDLCPSGEYMKCWYNTLTSVVSTDSGSTFSYNEPRLIAAIPYTAAAVQGDHAGFFNPSNIFGKDGYFYFFAWAIAPSPQKTGNCLFRSASISDSQAWRAWRNGSFSADFKNPYEVKVDPKDHICDTIDSSGLPSGVNTVVFHEPSRTWIATMMGSRPGKSGQNVTGVFYSTSKDLVTWTNPILLMEGNRHYVPSCKGPAAVAYPSIIDPDSKSRNFDTVGSKAYLTYTSMNITNCKYVSDRDLMAVPIEINGG